MYIYPTANSWQPLIDAYLSSFIYTWAIVNPNSGPGTSLDPNYNASIAKLHAADINTLGYVRTDYARQNMSTVKAEIDRWKQYYKPNGIFFDEMANDNQNVQYYVEADKYAKQQGFTFTVGNPGTNTLPQYFDTVDTIVIYENVGVPNKNPICSQNRNNNGIESVCVLAYNVPSLNATAVRNLKTCAGFIYVTNDNGTNPWDTLPDYLIQLFQLLAD